LARTRTTLPAGPAEQAQPRHPSHRSLAQPSQPASQAANLPTNQPVNQPANQPPAGHTKPRITLINDPKSDTQQPKSWTLDDTRPLKKMYRRNKKKIDERISYARKMYRRTENPQGL